MAMYLSVSVFYCLVSPAGGGGKSEVTRDSRSHRNVEMKRTSSEGKVLDDGASEGER